MLFERYEAHEACYVKNLLVMGYVLYTVTDSFGIELRCSWRGCGSMASTGFDAGIKSGFDRRRSGLITTSLHWKRWEEGWSRLYLYFNRCTLALNPYPKGITFHFMPNHKVAFVIWERCTIDSGPSLFSSESQLYKRVCPSVGRSVGRSLGQSVGRSVRHAFFFTAETACIMFD